MVRDARVLNLKHETGVENMHVTGAPVSAGNRPLLDQAREAAGGSQQTVDSTVSEKHRVLLSKVLVDPNVVLILSLVVRSRIDRVAIG